MLSASNFGDRQCAVLEADACRPVLAEFRAWFEAFDAQVWDDKIERDADAGKFDDAARQALRDYEDGHCKEL